MCPNDGEPAGSCGGGVITALVTRRGRNDRVVVRVGGAKDLELSSVLVEKAGLHVGFALGEEQREQLILEDQPYRARSRALHLLGVRDRSKRELETRLRQMGYGQEVITDTAAWLEGLGYLDDERFARNYAAEKLRTGWGPRRISAELARKGVERGIVDQAVAGEDDNSQAAVEGTQALMRLVRRRFGAQFATDPDSAERRLTGYLARRGYDWETVARIARELRAEAGGEATVP